MDNNSSKAYNIVTSKAYAEKVSQAAPDYELKVRLVDSDNMDMELLKSEIPALAVKYGASENQMFFSSNYFAMIEDGGSSSALIIAALFIVIACGIVIYSLFYISVIGKTKEYGRLKVLGTTPRQIKLTAMSTDNQKSVSKTLHSKITPAGLARMNFVRYRKKTLLTMVSFGFTGVLLRIVIPLIILAWQGKVSRTENTNCC